MFLQALFIEAFLRYGRLRAMNIMSSEINDRCERTFNRRTLPTLRDAMPRVKHSWHPEVTVGTRNGKRKKEKQKETGS